MTSAMLSCSSASPASLISESSRASRTLGGGRGVASVSWGPAALARVQGLPVGAGEGLLES